MLDSSARVRHDPTVSIRSAMEYFAHRRPETPPVEQLALSGIMCDQTVFVDEMKWGGKHHHDLAVSEALQLDALEGPE